MLTFSIAKIIVRIPNSDTDLPAVLADSISDEIDVQVDRFAEALAARLNERFLLPEGKIKVEVSW